MCVSLMTATRKGAGGYRRSGLLTLCGLRGGDSGGALPFAVKGESLISGDLFDNRGDHLTL
jgi:hypothetical protein